MRRVLVIIPAYNEAETIANVVNALHGEAPEYDVAVIDDGSTDDTARVASALDGVRLIRLPYNLGIGAAMQTGYKYAFRNGYDIAVQCDGDGQHPVGQIRSLVDAVEAGKADLVIGSRYVKNTTYKPSVSRRVGKSLLSRLVDAIAGGGITDTTSGFRATNRKVISLFARHYPDDYPEAEALIIVHKAGLKAAEIPVDMQPRQGGRTSINAVRAGYYIIKVSLAILVDVFRKFTHTTEGT